VLQKEYQSILEQAIEQLPAKQKMVFMMRYYEEMPYEEMAKILNKSVGGLKANYFHALKKVQEYVRRESNL
jgi:RNA polymerase sigma factor (sigma-70 family)